MSSDRLRTLWKEMLQPDNSSNYDVQWRHPFSIELNAFILLKITASV